MRACRRWTRWFFCAGILCLWSLASLQAQDKTTSSDLRQLRATYTAQLDKINRSSDATTTNLQSQYVKSLSSLEKTFQEQGKLEPLLAVKKERERFIADPKVEEAHIVADVAELSLAQINYRKAVDNLPLKKAKDIVTLADQYKKSLASLQEKLTKAGNIDAAIEAKKAGESIEDLPEVSASRFALADAEANKPPEPPKTESPAAPAATNPPPSKKMSQTATASKKKYTGKAENYIRQRFDDLCDVLLKQDMDKAIEFVDPRIVKERGTDQVRMQLRFVIPFLRWTEMPGVKFSPGDIKVDDKEQTATVIPRVWANNQWREMNASSWVQVDGDWFLTLGNSNEQRSGDDVPFRPSHRRHGGS
jgi:hypothetical protein